MVLICKGTSSKSHRFFRRRARKNEKHCRKNLKPNYLQRVWGNCYIKGSVRSRSVVQCSRQMGPKIRASNFTVEITNPVPSSNSICYYDEKLRVFHWVALSELRVYDDDVTITREPRTTVDGP